VSIGVTQDFLEEADENAARLAALESAVSADDLRRLCDLVEGVPGLDALDRAAVCRLRAVIGRVLP
jgi:hypothetical protein